MIRSLPFIPTTAFVAPVPPRREPARESDSGMASEQDAFNRLLAQQRDAARANIKQPVPTQAPAPPQVPAPAPIPAPTQAQSPTQGAEASSEARSEAQRANMKEKAEAGGAAPTPAPAPSAAAIRSANRSALRQGEGSTKPAQLDPESPHKEARHGRQVKGSEAEILAQLFKTTAKGLPVKQAPFGPEGPPETTPGEPVAPIEPGEPVNEDPADPGQINPQPPVIECPAEPVMAAQLLPATPQGLTLAAAATAEGASASDRDAGQPVATLGIADAAADERSGRSALQGTGAGAGAAQGATSGASTGTTPGGAPGSFAALMANDRRTETAAVTAEAATAAGSNTTGTPTPLATAWAAGALQDMAPPVKLASVDARPGTEAFATKFSAQVAVWVREGVHEAQLQLNPAEMGPVRVAILLEGAAAQVNFTAEHALTRLALEQAMPTLAGSLAEAGFTLAGGGVFDQQPQQSERSAGDEARRNAAGNPTAGRSALAGDEAIEPARMAAVRPRGVVDLVA